ncbi:hypothetical protein GCM10007972_23810 [Iodidimonas muriae]|uniref:Basal-body rod modification protein FlgD n=1 Tax=Iodidimonas muriae TaxID=261467 RepID=A0ABQ2LGE8_9PROT|nr:flagellar hook assembly protein FlgD [Iodidimonas muriae]GER08578.1 hypothetical protein JCM17843_28880 [Kordiimonadales bacterium JCM 17843]GGO15567.1 hypothetical protein GCM10007972_23810 [Iodidimonas muriae]
MAFGGTTSVSGVTGNALSGDIDTFLQLLTTQLRNQDPLNPVDNTEFVAQLAQFSQVEQQIDTNQGIRQMLDVMRSQSLRDSVSLMGHQVEIAVDQTALTASGASIAYRLDQPVDGVDIRILDQAGEVVATIAASGSQPGLQSLIWDGRGTDGVRVQDGVYNIEIAAQRAGVAQNVQPLLTGNVAQVRIGDGGESRIVLDSGAETGVDQLVRISSVI